MGETWKYGNMYFRKKSYKDQEKIQNVTIEKIKKETIAELLQYIKQHKNNPDQIIYSILWGGSQYKITQPMQNPQPENTSSSDFSRPPQNSTLSDEKISQQTPFFDPKQNKNEENTTSKKRKRESNNDDDDLYARKRRKRK